MSTSTQLPIVNRARRTSICFLVLLCLLSLFVETKTQEEDFYTCVSEYRVDQALIGVTLCDAVATASLINRSEVDNLQVRDGALITKVVSAGVSATEGLRPGDMIYRIGGVDVDNAVTSNDAIQLIGTSEDTVVNFLRFGRPYRVKLRQNRDD